MCTAQTGYAGFLLYKFLHDKKTAPDVIYVQRLFLFYEQVFIKLYTLFFNTSGTFFFCEGPRNRFRMNFLSV